jgi:hypothetical protein
VLGKDVLVIVPTRGRPDASLEFHKEFLAKSMISDLMFAIDEDDADSYPRIDGVLYEVNPRMGMNGTLNYVATKYADKYKYIAFMGDDHRVRTFGWDLVMAERIGSLGVAYGNDLIQGQALPTSVMMSSKIIKAIGYMAPPKQKHMYLDNFWLDLGTRLNAIHYLEDVIIEHLHFSVGKSDMDSSYQETNDSAIYNADKVAYDEYLSTQMDIDIDKILKCVNG